MRIILVKFFITYKPDESVAMTVKYIGELDCMDVAVRISPVDGFIVKEELRIEYVTDEISSNAC